MCLPRPRCMRAPSSSRRGRRQRRRERERRRAAGAAAVGAASVEGPDTAVQYADVQRRAPGTVSVTQATCTRAGVSSAKHVLGRLLGNGALFLGTLGRSGSGQSGAGAPQTAYLCTSARSTQAAPRPDTVPTAASLRGQHGADPEVALLYLSLRLWAYRQPLTFRSAPSHQGSEIEAASSSHAGPASGPVPDASADGRTEGGRGGEVQPSNGNDHESRASPDRPSSLYTYIHRLSMDV
ncbi:hypothetical protein CDD83_8629 [Cordyceps sp. RAO-2017]|nr:hypothetical protein CDD83_8629 [Cordyceps sp. RAO-2017]